LRALTISAGPKVVNWQIAFYLFNRFENKFKSLAAKASGPAQRYKKDWFVQAAVSFARA
jgi:hypothetical protein